MEIRRFDESDTKAVVTLWTQVFGYTASHNDPARVIEKKREVQPELFFVAQEGDRLVGTVMGGYDGHRGWIYSLAVAPDFRRRGIGRLLMEQVEQSLAKRECEKINLQVFATNSQTAAFYQKLGYAVEERISMGKLLNPQ